MVVSLTAVCGPVRVITAPSPQPSTILEQRPSGAVLAYRTAAVGEVLDVSKGGTVMTVPPFDG
ncbi:hypothetical protein [Streptomyces lonarensis]|uniref:Uncharacterized protein n=1 Tax=Streptomyces lonarensis TaxID=700599 RepID=A0A7X6D2Q9_9ACTN|nr:hypothetical protein [Streptomyces lonarensis]NJQ07000.1 hypothetical protein [Streptomyces lonarensis]